jgi:hypothetical protein
MTAFRDLPPEIINRILQYQSISHKAVDLFKCGNILLNIKIINGGATIIELEDKKWNSTSRFPKMLSKLRFLTSLSINRGDRAFMDPYELGICLQSLSSTLEEITLICLQSHAAFFANPASKEKPTLYSETPPTASRFWDISFRFPNLTKLWVSGIERSPFDQFMEASPSVHWVGSDLPHLPSTLTTLCLTLFELPREPIPGLWPQHLKHLEINQWSYAGLTTALLESFPRSLTVLSTKRTIPPQEAPLMIPALPQTLKIAPVQCFVPGIADWLPTLVSLEILSGIHSRLSKEMLLALPKTIQKLHVWSISFETGIAPADFPSSLTELNIYSIIPNEAHLKLLPNTLKHLQVSLDRSQPFEASKLSLPPCLTLLTLSAKLCGTGLLGLPSTLTILDSNSDSQGWSLESTQNLPRTLTRLTLAQTTLTTSALSGLPPKLVCLRLNAIMADPGTDIKFIFTNLPPNLTNLSLLSMTNKSTPLAPESLLGLPPSILILTIDAQTKLDVDIFAFLPRGLHEFFSNSVAGHLLESHIQTLPRGLRKCQLSPTMKDGSLRLKTLQSKDSLPQHLEDASYLLDSFHPHTASLQTPDPRVIRALPLNE